jgi:hypothetical protein
MVDRLLGFLARWRGLPVMLGLVLVILNFIAGFIPGATWLIWHNWLLHLGVIVGLLSLLLTETL